MLLQGDNPQEGSFEGKMVRYGQAFFISATLAEALQTRRY